MSCPFSKEYFDFGNLMCCHYPDDPCKNRRYSSYIALIQHAKKKKCLYHTILHEYLVAFNKEYERQVLYPTKWAYDSNDNSCRLFFESEKDYYDVKKMATSLTTKYINDIPDAYPFRRFNYQNYPTKKNTLINILNTMFRCGFEAKIHCPFSKSYLKKLSRHEKYSYVSTCPCLDVDYKDINELVNHCKWNRCDNHRVLYEYLRYF